MENSHTVHRGNNKKCNCPLQAELSGAFDVCVDCFRYLCGGFWLVGLGFFVVLVLLWFFLFVFNLFFFFPKKMTLTLKVFSTFKTKAMEL